MHSQYRILFSIELQHEYFLNRKCNDLEIVPAEDCLALFKRLKIHWRNFDNRFIALIEENSQQEPLVNIPPNKHYRKNFGSKVFRFYLKLKNPLFSNYTNAAGAYNGSKKLYFSNSAKNKSAEVLYLSQPLVPFANDTAYIPGNLVTDARTGNVFEALKKYTSKKKAELSDASLWAPKGLSNLTLPLSEHVAGKLYLPGDLVKQPGSDNMFEAIQRQVSVSEADLNNAALWKPRGQGQLQYVTEKDTTEYCNAAYRFQLSKPIQKAEISVFEFNYKPDAPAYDVPVKEPETKNFGAPVSEVLIDLAGLKSGRCLVKVNKETALVYYDPVLNRGQTYGVIEIFNYLPGADEYSFLTDDEKIKSTTYQLLFPARRVLWKYIRRDSKAQTITDVGDTGYQFNLTGDEFISSIPIPLSEGVLKTLKLEFNTSDFKMQPLPNPSIERLGRCTQNEYDYLCSEMNLNY